MKVKVTLKQAGKSTGSLDERARTVFLRELKSGVSTPQAAPMIAAGGDAIHVYLTPAQVDQVQTLGVKKGGQDAAQVLTGIVKEHLRKEGPDALQVTALKSMFGHRKLTGDGLQAMKGRSMTLIHVTPAECEQLTLLAQKASGRKEIDSVGAFVNDLIGSYLRTQGPAAGMEQTALKSIYGPTPAAKEADPHEGIRNPHGPRPVIVPGQRY